MITLFMRLEFLWEYGPDYFAWYRHIHYTLFFSRVSPRQVISTPATISWVPGHASTWLPPFTVGIATFILTIRPMPQLIKLQKSAPAAPRLAFLFLGPTNFLPRTRHANARRGKDSPISNGKKPLEDYFLSLNYEYLLYTIMGMISVS